MREDTSGIMARLSVALDMNQPMPRDLADWLSGGLHRFRNGGPGITLCGALGLAKTKAAQRAERDYWLCVASDHITFNEHRSRWYRAGRLVDLIKSFENSMWPAIQDARQPVDGLRPSYDAIYRAKMAVDGAALSTNRDNIYKMLLRRLPKSA